MRVVNGDDSLIVDISDALSERDRVRFTVHTRTTLPQFAKPVLSVVRQHEEFIWLHDCLEDNDKYAGYIIPPAPPKPDFDASREKLQRLGDGEANMTKEEFTKMKQELEAEYLAIFKKTVAMHEIFLQRLAAHNEFRLDDNFKIFLEYENELAVRCKSKKERLAGSIQNLGKSLTDFVITTSQVAATTSASTSILAGHSPTKHSLNKQHLASSSSNNTLMSTNTHKQTHKHTNGNTSTSDISYSSKNIDETDERISTIQTANKGQYSSKKPEHLTLNTGADSTDLSGSSLVISEGTSNNKTIHDQNQESINEAGKSKSSVSEEDIDEQYFEKERLFLALYHNSIRDTAVQSDKVVQLQKCVADSYLCIAQQLVKLASIEVLPITTQTKDSSSFVSCPLPSLNTPYSLSRTKSATQLRLSKLQPSTLASLSMFGDPNTSVSADEPSKSKLMSQENYSDHIYNNESKKEFSVNADGDDENLLDSIDLDSPDTPRASSNKIDSNQSDRSKTNENDIIGIKSKDSERFMSEFSISRTSESLKQLLLHVSDYFEQARKIETRIASDEDLKLTDLFLYYKRDTVAAQDLLTRRMRFMAEYETATKNLEKARQKGRTQLQYAEVIQKQAKENFISISKLAKQELINYKQRRVDSFRRAFADIVQLELKHLQVHSQLIVKCLNTYRDRSNTN